jgi:Protein of unknown function (DUF3592)
MTAQRGSERARREEQLAARARAYDRFLGASCLLLGSLSLALLLVAIVRAKPWKWSRMLGADRTTGRVVDLVLVQGVGGGIDVGGSFHPHVRYEVAGKSYEIGGLGNTGYKIGDAVPVTYPPNQPADGIIDRPLEKVAPVLVWGGIGSIFVVAGLALLRSGRDGKNLYAT